MSRQYCITWKVGGKWLPSIEVDERMKEIYVRNLANWKMDYTCIGFTGQPLSKGTEMKRYVRSNMTQEVPIEICWKLPTGKWMSMKDLTSHELRCMTANFRKKNIEYRTKINGMVFKSRYQDNVIDGEIVEA